jgi:hypothetical protein
MSEGQFEYPVGAKAVGFSLGDLRLIIRTFHDATRNEFLGPEVIQCQFPILAERAGDLYSPSCWKAPLRKLAQKVFRSYRSRSRRRKRCSSSAFLGA